MSNQARASRHASGILPSKQFFAPRKPITQSVSLRRKSTSPIVPNSPNAQTSPTLQTTPLSFTSTTDSPLPGIQSEEEGMSLLHQPKTFTSFSPVTTSLNPSLDQSLDSIFNPELSQSAPGRTPAPIRPPSALLIRRSYRQQSGDISQATIDSILEPAANVPVLESAVYRPSARQNIDSRDFATAVAFTGHPDNDLPNTPSAKLHLISPKNTSTKQTPPNATAYSVVAKSMPRLVATKSDPTHDISKKGHKRLYQAWPGRNRFFLGGRIMTSRDFPAFLVAFCALTIPSGLFMGFTCPFLYHNVSPAVVFVFVYFFLLALASMLRTSWSDPGIIPRNLDPSPPTEDLEDTENHADNNNAYFPTRSVPLPKEAPKV
ncbi:10091_t:CDS:2 [Acaulospora colombiana]|uniref:10091_t:CDS:1 n=1 Tax=Acaulospora colombiana TaxID=27376 RepID=A0ACA9KCG0_9GLOM|nr:10091_t:CDS:2 [Acaulospora colombiana]